MNNELKKLRLETERWFEEMDKLVAKAHYNNINEYEPFKDDWRNKLYLTLMICGIKQIDAHIFCLNSKQS